MGAGACVTGGSVGAGVAGCSSCGAAVVTFVSAGSVSAGVVVFGFAWQLSHFGALLDFQYPIGPFLQFGPAIFPLSAQV